MIEQRPPDGEQGRFEIVFELPPSPQGTYQYEREDGTTVHADAGGEWTLNEDGEVDDIVFFASPRWLADLSREGPSNRKSSGTEKTP